MGYLVRVGGVLGFVVDSTIVDCFFSVYWFLFITNARPAAWIRYPFANNVTVAAANG